MIATISGIDFPLGGAGVRSLQEPDSEVRVGEREVPGSLESERDGGLGVVPDFLCTPEWAGFCRGGI